MAMIEKSCYSASCFVDSMQLFKKKRFSRFSPETLSIKQRQTAKMRVTDVCQGGDAGS
jgi:hypothetical protein